MDARTIKARMATALLLLLSLAVLSSTATAAQERTPNFIVETDDPAFAKQVAQAAEHYRHDLAINWTGEAMPRWSQPCMMTVTAGPRLDACGATTFVFSHGEVYDWRMKIQGSRERVLDSVLPHEITHMIFACRFREPLPRWVDEGGATSVEHMSERNKYREMLPDLLRNNRGIAFNEMFGIMEYPADYMPLYAQGYSLAEYLIQQGGRRRFVEFIDDGLKSENWPAAVERNYGMRGLGGLQQAWLAWVRQGSPLKKLPSAADEMLAAGRLARPESNLIYHASNNTPIGNLQPIRHIDSAVTPAVATTAGGAPSKILPADGWHKAVEVVPTAIAAAPAPSQSTPPVLSINASRSTPSVDPFTISTQVAHPQPFERPEQTVLR